MSDEDAIVVKILWEITEAVVRNVKISKVWTEDFKCERKRSDKNLDISSVNKNKNFKSLSSVITKFHLLKAPKVFPDSNSATAKTGGLIQDLKASCDEKTANETVDISDDDDIYSGTTEIIKIPPICDICNKWFTKKSSLKAHYQIHAGVKPYICEVCFKTFSKKSVLDTHLLVHTGERKFFCEICDKRFARKTDLNKHLLTHTNQKPHVCELCSKSFNDKSNLRKHKALHAREKHHKCNICRQAFTQKEVLLNHLKNHYLELSKSEPPEKEKLRQQNYLKTMIQKHFYKCNDCDKLFLRKRRLEKHKLTHKSDHAMIHICEVCNARFKSKDTLQEHLLNHIVLTFNNETVDPLDSLSSNFNLDADDDFDLFDDISINAALDIDPNFNFDLLDDLTFPNSPNPEPADQNSKSDKTCDICFKKFTRRSSLRDHYLTHSGEKPHKCKVCGKSFSQKVTLKRHALTHSGARPFVCKVCNKSFARKTSLRKHYISHSSKKLF